MPKVEDTPEEREALLSDIARFYPEKVKPSYAPATLHCFRALLKLKSDSRYWGLQLVNA